MLSKTIRQSIGHTQSIAIDCFVRNHFICFLQIRPFAYCSIIATNLHRFAKYFWLWFWVISCATRTTIDVLFRRTIDLYCGWSSVKWVASKARNSKSKIVHVLCNFCSIKGNINIWRKVCVIYPRLFDRSVHINYHKLLINLIFIRSVSLKSNKVLCVVLLRRVHDDERSTTKWK